MFLKDRRTLASPIMVENTTNLTVPDLVRQKISDGWKESEDVWMIDAITSTQYRAADFGQTAWNAAKWFYQTGMRKGDVLLYLTHNISTLPLVFIGVWQANGIVRSAHPEDPAESLLAKVVESTVKWIYCEAEDSEKVLRVVKQCSWAVQVIVNGSVENSISIEEVLSYSDASALVPQTEIGADDVAMILSTSGTTGRSRGVVRTHRSIVNFISTHNLFPWKRRNLLQFKATHATGSLVPLANLVKGVTTIAVWRMDGDSLCKAVDSYRPGTVAAFPSSLLTLVNALGTSDYDFSSVRTLITGGAHVTPAMRQQLMTLPSVEQILQVYGLSECAAVIVNIDYLTDGSWRIVAPPRGKSGKVAPGKLVQIRDPDTIHVYGPNEIGEICVKSPELFSHYLNNPEATGAAFTDDGYFRTRDLGYFDEGGYVSVVGRLDDVFRYDQKLISPDHLDDIISEHPAVVEVCTIGVPLGGGCHVPRAFVTTHADHESLEELVASILEFVHERVPNHMKLRGGLYVVPSLPRGTTGKVSRMLVSRLPV